MKFNKKFNKKYLKRTAKPKVKKTHFQMGKLRIKKINLFKTKKFNTSKTKVLKTVAPLQVFGRKIKKTFLNKPLLRKILYTLLLLLIFRIAATITVPGIKTINRNVFNSSSSFLSLMDLMGGGAINRFSIVALGISPYITASILMTILQSELFPPLYRLANSGAEGRRKINIITRWITLVIGIFQAITISQSFQTSGILHFIPRVNQPWYKFIGLPLILLAGSMFTLFLGESITKKGVGNGTSLIIFSGVAVAVPGKLRAAFNYFIKPGTDAAFLGTINFIGYMFLILALIFIIGYIYKSERHIPLQQTGKGMTKDAKQMSRLPIKLNTAGVIPIMFAALVVIIPLQVAQLLPTYYFEREWIQNNLTFTKPIGLSIFAAVIFFFSIVMSLLIFQPSKVAENFFKSGTFIPGIRPGNDTERYINRTLLRLSFFSGIYLVMIGTSTYLMQIFIFNSTQQGAQATFGGTSLIILISVSIETWQQMKTRKHTRNISKFKTTSKKSGGSLW